MELRNWTTQGWNPWDSANSKSSKAMKWTCCAIGSVSEARQDDQSAPACSRYCWNWDQGSWAFTIGQFAVRYTLSCCASGWAPPSSGAGRFRLANWRGSFDRAAASAAVRWTWYSVKSLPPCCSWGPALADWWSSGKTDHQRFWSGY